MNWQEIPWLSLFRLLMEGIGWISCTILSAVMLITVLHSASELFEGRPPRLRELDRYP